MLCAFDFKFPLAVTFTFQIKQFPAAGNDKYLLDKKF